MAGVIEPGSLLISTVELDNQPEFRRSVILMLECDLTKGVKGVIINHPLKEQQKGYRLEWLEELAGGVDTVDRLFFQGGPVEQDHLVCLHTQDAVGGTEICPGIFAFGELEVIRAQSAKVEQPSSVMRFYLGFSGWVPGQLEQEINAWESWILCPGRADLIFDPEPDTVWRKALYGIGGKYRPMSLIPEDLTVN